MLSVDGYTVWDRIHDTRHSEVYTGSRQADDLQVVLKVYRGDRASSLERAERELELLERIRADGVVRPVELQAHARWPVLVLERFPGFPLSRYARSHRLGIEEFLGIALELARILAVVHDARIIHKDIKLGNVLIDPESHDICLIDFGISAEFGRAERTAPTRAAEGTIRYIAPEQTGRMGLGLDFRTDLYSLGASFYELLAGRPPFHGKTGMELITAHIALRPRPAVEVDPRIPRALSRIVDRLLEKDPELRYQTARGLAADLAECQKQLLTSGEIDDDLVLGTWDASDRLRFPNRLYGRDQEETQLRAALERVAQGHIEVALVSGPPGIGKSSMHGVLRPHLARCGGYLTEASFDPGHRERPYAAFAAALGSLIDQMLSESRERVEMWRDALHAELGPIGSVLVELAPSLGLLVEDFPPVEPAPAEHARERLALAVVRFVQAVACSAHPLVLVLDDLQWADAGSLFLLRAILRPAGSEALLVIGGYRDGEVGPDHPWAELERELVQGPLPVLHLPLAPLGPAETQALLSDVLGRPPAETEWLARRVGPKSQHNPLLLRRLMFHLWDRDLIHYRHGVGWVWDERRLTEADITDDAAAMMAARIDALPETTQRLIRVASLIGRSFDLELLVELAQEDRLDVLQQLMSLVDQGLLAPCEDGFKFVHDRLREAAQARLAAPERAALHHRAAQRLLDRTPPERLPETSFQLAEHLSGAFEALTEAERPRAVEIFALAASQALARGAPDTALQHAERAESLLRESDWQTHPALAFGARRTVAEAAFQSRDFDRALDLLGHLESRAPSVLERAEVTTKRIEVHSVVGSEQAVDLALQVLRTFGVRWPRRPSRLRTRLEILRTDLRLRGRVDRMFCVRTVPDMNWFAPVRILGAAGAPFGHRSLRLHCLSVAYVLRSYQRHTLAPVESGGLALAAYAALRIRVRGDLRGAARYVHAARYWIDQGGSSRRRVRAEILLLAYVEPWLVPRRSLLGPLERASERARDLGDLEFALYATHQHVSSAALSGWPLPTLMERVEQLGKGQQGTYAHGYDRIYELAYGRLRGPSLPALDLERARAILQAPIRPNADVYVGAHWIASLCVTGDFEAAAVEIDRLWDRIREGGMIGSAFVDYTLYRGLCHGALARSQSASPGRRRHLRILRQCARQMRVWARVGSDFVHMARLLDAELQAARGRVAAALRTYHDAAERASKAAYTHHVALCHERRAWLLVRADRVIEADAARRSAIALYREWGAPAKVHQLEQDARAE